MGIDTYVYPYILYCIYIYICGWKYSNLVASPPGLTTIIHDLGLAILLLSLQLEIEATALN